ncbi:hypothetical protein [Paenibacillus xylanexedens]|uniref:hypothetical protein n=1 Tax=Paenibacillus xylanexedens TaxID=528191 RepID=UPI00119C9CC6|nr:hypothetical protein [Paenibacillus xylanexedens]
MGISAVILKKKDKYSPEKLLADTIVAAFHSDAALYFYNSKTYTNEGEFLYTTLNINRKSFTGDKESSFIFHIHSISSPSTEFYYYEDLGLGTSESLYQVGHIEDIYGSQELILHFMYEYLKLNPDDYFWIADNDWVYRWEDILRLKSSPYDSDWCYRNPKDYFLEY